MAPRVPPTGVFVPSPTFFKPVSSSSSSIQAPVDIETQVAHSVHLAKNGIRGLVLLGSTGEAIHMSRSERYDFISGVIKGLDAAGFPDYPIMAGVLTNSVEDVLEWIGDFHKAGAQWAMVLAPGYFGPVANQDNLVEWYTLVADRSPIPILIYHYPGVTNMVNITIQTYVKLAAHPNIVGCKMSHGNMSHHMQVSLNPSIDHDHFRVYSGFGQQSAPLALTGAAGVIDGLGATFPKAISSLWDLGLQRPVTNENLEKLQKMQFTVSNAMEFVVKNGIVGMKEATYRVLKMGNMDGGRLPLKGKLAPGEWEAWKDAFDDMAKLEAA